ncbi:MAG: hypothetical protein ACP5KF_05445, partial [Sulfurihydrogenibium sp.]
MSTNDKKNINQNTKKVNKVESQTENQIKALQTLFKLRPKKKVKRIQNKKEVGSKVYRQDEAIILMEVVEDDKGKKRIVDIIPIKTVETLEKFLEKSNKNFMVLPNPV